MLDDNNYFGIGSDDTSKSEDVNSSTGNSESSLNNCDFIEQTEESKNDDSFNNDSEQNVQHSENYSPYQSSQQPQEAQHGEYYSSPSQNTYYSYTPNAPRSNNQYQYYPYYPNNNSGQPVKLHKQHKGIKITLIVLGIIAVITAVCFVGFWALSELGTFLGKQGVFSTSSNSKESDKNEVESDALENIIINSKPSGSNEYVPNSDGTLTAAAVIKKVRPSIVGIVKYAESMGGIPTESGEGSGIVISEDGYIITNAHVVSDAVMVKVVFENGDEVRAEVKGADSRSDLAILKVNAKGLTPAELGKSSQTVVGEGVIAIGNPGGLELAGSCTGGMVSGLNRTISGDSVGYAMSYIQTDAAINPGNSGGALVNMYGQVIGINSAKITSSGYEGLGFAIPIDDAIPIIKDLQQYGYVKNRATIGINFQLITETVSQYYNYSIPCGLLVTNINESCDAARKGIETNDIITHIDGKQITSENVVYSILQSKKPGDTVKLSVFRIGTRTSTSKTFEVTVKLSEDDGTTLEE